MHDTLEGLLGHAKRGWPARLSSQEWPNQCPKTTYVYIQVTELDFNTGHCCSPFDTHSFFLWLLFGPVCITWWTQKLQYPVWPPGQNCFTTQHLFLGAWYGCYLFFRCWVAFWHAVWDRGSGGVWWPFNKLNGVYPICTDYRYTCLKHFDCNVFCIN